MGETRVCPAWLIHCGADHTRQGHTGNTFCSVSARKMDEQEARDIWKGGGICTARPGNSHNLCVSDRFKAPPWPPDCETCNVESSDVVRIDAD